MRLFIQPVPNTRKIMGINFRKDVQTVFVAIPCNPFQLDSLCIINDIAYKFPESETLKIVLSEVETQFIRDCLILQKTPITTTI